MPTRTIDTAKCRVLYWSDGRWYIYDQHDLFDGPYPSKEAAQAVLTRWEREDYEARKQEDAG